jgi:hypothetical protein
MQHIKAMWHVKRNVVIKVMWQCSTSKQCSRTKAMWQCSISKSGFVSWNRQRKIYIVALWAWGGRRSCELRDDVGSTVSWALDITGLGRTTVLWARGRHGSSASWAQEWRRVHSVAGLRRTTLLWAQERSRRLGDVAYVVDSVTDSGWGRWQCARSSIVVRNDGAEAPRRTRRWRGDSEEASTTAWALGRSTMALAPGKFWQPDGVSESLRGLGFFKGHTMVYL